MGNNISTNGTTVSIVLPFAPKIVIIFPFADIAWIKGSTSSGASNKTYSRHGFLQWLDSFDLSSYKYYAYSMQYVIWYDGITKMALTTNEGEYYYQSNGSELTFSVNGTTFSWTVGKPNDADAFDDPRAEYIYNQSKTYHYIAFG